MNPELNDQNREKLQLGKANRFISWFVLQWIWPLIMWTWCMDFIFSKNV